MSASVVPIKCPSCGAAADPIGSRHTCAYCGTSMIISGNGPTARVVKGDHGWALEYWQGGRWMRSGQQFSTEAEAVSYLGLGQTGGRNLITSIHPSITMSIGNYACSAVVRSCW